MNQVNSKRSEFPQIAESSTGLSVPVLPLRDKVILPGEIVSLVVGRGRSVAAMQEAVQKRRELLIVAQRDQAIEQPKPEDLYQVGTLARVIQVVKLDGDSYHVVVEGRSRVRVVEYLATQSLSYLAARITPLTITSGESIKLEALRRSITERFGELIAAGRRIPLEIREELERLTHDPERFANLVLLALDLSNEERQEFLEVGDMLERFTKLIDRLIKEIDVLKLEKKLERETSKQIGKMQKEIILRERMRAIEKELGVSDERGDLASLAKKLERARLSKEAKAKAKEEMSRLRRMNAYSPEVSYIRTYLEWLSDLPWSTRDKKPIDMKAAKKVLDADHYGLKDIKERILEYLAVQKLRGKIQGSILCFVGAPGTGKTSIGQSIAKAMGRKFVRVSLGGIRDEAEIRGHRRTYVGAMPGRIIQKIKDAGTKNPVFMLDEIDKIGQDFRGDPAAALLEALDPEQNSNFSDHYLEVPFDLSEVLFIGTANILDTIPPALRDRLEVLRFPGYTEEEKFTIARKHLLPRVIIQNGLTARQVTIDDETLRFIIRRYTREAGLRNLERELARIARKVARKVSEKRSTTVHVSHANLTDFLGPAKFPETLKEEKDEIGMATGLAWTAAGGEILTIEALPMPGRGNVTITGQLGKVMRESAQAAFSFVRSRAELFRLSPDVAQKVDLHIHVPSGAIPKDGPSAGVALATAIASALAKIPVRKDVGMTGEVTLRGKVLEIGGIKEKVLAAHRAGLTTIILPKDNEKDLTEIPENIRSDLKFIFAGHVDEVFAHALTEVPTKTKREKPHQLIAPRMRPTASIVT
ncbi:MAG: endopeptidase La [Parcubacteria group bacterium]|nr:endopeptidase La [Parcubacteria group bacterium]